MCWHTLQAFFLAAVCGVAIVPRAMASSEAPPWMHALVGATLPAYDEKTNAVLLYSDTNVTVLSTDKIRTHVREAYKILRPEGRNRGTVEVGFYTGRKIKSLHGWCIPAQGKDYEVKDKDALEASSGPGFELYSDVKVRVLKIPAPDPGNIIGYEYEVEEQPFWLQDVWEFQEIDPVRESHYSLQLPPGWVFKASWLFHPEVKPDETSGNALQWAVTDVKGIRREPDMPPWRGIDKPDDRFLLSLWWYVQEELVHQLRGHGAMCMGGCFQGGWKHLIEIKLEVRCVNCRKEQPLTEDERRSHSSCNTISAMSRSNWASGGC